ncbi:MAG: transglutaminase domain-containing protein [Bdellovibrionales bacterium]|nr:transglutaminase domain-containing protein [Bdellovibrionales bacterium]
MKPQLSSPEHRQFVRLQFMRALILSLGAVFLWTALDLGTSIAALIAAPVIGVIAAGWGLLHGTRFSRMLFFHVAAAAAFWGVFQLLLLGGDDSEALLSLYRVWTHVQLLAAFYVAALLLTWFFWTVRSAVTFETVAASGMVVWLLGPHRNYQLDAPKDIVKLAWENPFLTVAPQHFLLGLGVVFTLFLIAYLVLSHNRPLIGSTRPVRSAGRSGLWASLLPAIAVLAYLIGFAFVVNQNYAQDLSRASNGVGTDENKEGESPLGFHSAVGKTKQPAALVRLEGDFAENPWTPMLYLREGALSAFNGHELVFAGGSYDDDVPRVGVGQPYVGIGASVPDFRTPLTQSVYLLTKHKAPFAVDYPQTIRLIKNPDPERFLLAYQALSYAPRIPLQTLIGEDIGNPEWTEETWAHYLRAPGSRTEDAQVDKIVADGFADAVPDTFGEDLRYRAFEEQLVDSDESPVQQAIAIISYLSKESIYTRKPGHTVTERGDPVAPYLFSEDKRGYCVHFAHAAVYLMRLAGIPARIATGYLTDLTYAKDGHILLHLGDRHAWPEIYVRGVGWVVADITPENAEGEEPLVPDENLLEELMSKIDPAEELITPPPLAPEDELPVSIFEKTLTARNLQIGVLLAFLAFVFAKCWLRFGWMVNASPSIRTKRAYRSVASLLADIGWSREFGETRREYARRIRSMVGLDLDRLTLHTERVVYGGAGRPLAAEELRLMVRECDRSFDTSRSRWRRVAAFFSPVSFTKLWRL